MDFLPTIITVAVVFVMLVIFRALDKNNQSLDKVRRYGDKVKEDISAFVDSKNQILKNAAIELDVYKKAEEQLYARISGIEERLNGRAGDVESLFDRISEYDKALTDLVEMTHKVDENLQLLKAEDIFLDNLSKRIHSTNVQMDKVGGQVSRLLKEFSETNDQQMRDLWVNAVKEANGSKERLESQLDQIQYSVNEFSDYMQQLEVTRDGIEETLLTSAKDQLTLLVNRSVEKFDTVADEMKEELDTFVVQYKKEVEGFGVETHRLRDDYNASLNKNAEILKKYLKASESMLGKMQISTDELAEKANYVENIIGQIHQYDEDVLVLTKLSTDVQKNLLELKQGASFISTATKKMQAAENTFARIEEKIPQIEQRFIVENQNSLTELSKDVKESIENTAKSFLIDFNRVQDSVDEFSGIMQNLESHRKELFDGADRELTVNLKTILAEKTKEATQISNNFKHDLTQFSLAMVDSFQDRLVNFRGEYNEVEDSARTLSSKVLDLSNKSLREIGDLSSSSIEELKLESAMIREATGAVFETVKEKSEDLHRSFQVVISEKELALKTQNDECEGLLSQIKNVLGGLDEKRTQIDQIIVRLANYDEQMGRLAKMNREAADSLTYLEKRKNFIEHIDSKLKRSEKFVTEIEERIPKIQEQFSQENEHRLESSVKQLLADTDRKTLSLREEMGNITQSVDEFKIYLGLLQNRRDQLGTSLLDKIKDRISKMGEDTLSSLTSQLKDQTTTHIFSLEGEIGEHVQKFETQLEEITTKAKSTTAQAEKTTFTLTTNLRQDYDSIRKSISQLTKTFQEGADHNEERFNKQRSSGSALFLQLQTLVEQLSSRGEEIDSIYNRLTEVDLRMVQLGEMGKEADEGLNTLKKQTRFIQGLAKSIKQDEVRLNTLEKRIPLLHEEFSKESKLSLESIYQKTLTDANLKFQALEKNVVDVSSEISSFSTELDGVEAKTRQFAAQSFELFQGQMDTMKEKNKIEQDGFWQKCKTNIDAYQTNFDNEIDTILLKFKSTVEEADARFATIDDLSKNKLALFSDEATKIETHFQENMTQVMDRVQQLDEEVFGTLKKEIQDVAQETRKFLFSSLDQVKEDALESNKDVIAIFEKLQNDILVGKENGVIQVSKLKKDLADDFSTWENRLKVDIDALKRNTLLTQDENNQRVKSFQEKSQEVLNTSYEKVDKQVDSVEKRLVERLASFSTKMEKLSSDSMIEFTKVEKKLSAQASQYEVVSHSRLVDLEKELTDFEQTLQGKYDALDRIPNEMDQVEVSLRSYMEEESRRIRNDFVFFSKELNEEREIEKKAAVALFKDFNSSIEEVKTNIETIKTEAQENISAKLSILEEDFFSDLKVRRGGMESEITLLKKGVLGSIGEISTEAQVQRLELENRLTQEFESKFFKLQSTHAQSLASITNRIDVFKGDINLKLTNSEGDLEHLSDKLLKSFEILERNSLKTIDDRLNSHGDQVNEKITEYKSYFESKFAVQKQVLDSGEVEVADVLAKSRQSITTWQKDVLSEWETRRNELDSNFESLKIDSTTQISEVRDSFIKQKENLEENHSVYLDELAVRITGFNDQIVKSNLSFDNKVEFVRKVTADVKTDLQTTKSTMRQELLELQRGLEERIVDSVNVLDTETSKIHTKVDNFIAQTKLFERADTLKDKLLEEIRIIKHTIEGLKADKRELRETDKSFANIRGMESEVSSKLSGMRAQRQKIEEMDVNFKRLLGISLDVDTRLQNISEKSDKLQSIEVQLRHLKEIEEEVGKQYVRLDKKQEILETTREGVDSSFKKLFRLEESMKGIEGNFTRFLLNLKKADERIITLSDNKSDADRAIVLLSKFDSELKDLEDRLNEVQKSRQWLADTETRIKQLAEKSEEQIQLFGGIMRQSGSPVKNISGTTSKDMVLSFAKMGWSNDQIVNATKLSRGEVELILQIANKKG